MITVYDINGKHTIKREPGIILGISTDINGNIIAVTYGYFDWQNPYGYTIPEKTTDEYLYNITTEKKCEYCSGSGESQKWNMDKRMMETINNGCNYCNGTGYINTEI